MVANGLRTPMGPASPPYAHGPYEMDQVLVMNKPSVDSYKRYTLEENFNRLPGTNGDIAVAYNLDFEVVGTGASQDDVTYGAEVGGILLTSDSTAAQQVIIAPHLDAEQTAWAGVLWGTENQVIWEAVVRTGASVASIILWAGLKLTNDQDIATDDDSCFFRFDAGVANWEAVYAIADTDTEVDTGITVAVNTNYYFRIEIDKDRKAHFFINNKEVARSTAMTDDIDLIPYVGVEGNAKTFYLVKEKISRIIFE